MLQSVQINLDRYKQSAGTILKRFQVISDISAPYCFCFKRNSVELNKRRLHLLPSLVVYRGLAAKKGGFMVCWDDFRGCVLHSLKLFIFGCVKSPDFGKSLSNLVGSLRKSLREFILCFPVELF